MVRSEQDVWGYGFSALDRRLRGRNSEWEVHALQQIGEKARRRAPSCDEGCVGLGCSGDRYMPKLGHERVLIVVAAT